MLLMIDNLDSFTFNIVRYFKELNADVQVYRNNAITIAEIERLAPDQIVISPGPCTPDQAGISLEVIRHFAGKLPILGICLGHQALGQVFGARVVRAAKVMHGKVSQINHDGRGVFTGLEQPLAVTRYHSLVLEQNSLPDCLEVTAMSVPSEAGEVPEIMGVRHRDYAIEGVQFHPESVMTKQGHALLKNFLDQAASD